MKIAILTQPLRYNYGGIIQNYALQKSLADLGHDVKTIDVHRERGTLHRYLYYTAKFILFGHLRTVSPPVSRKRFLREIVNLRRFISKNIKLTEYIPNYKKLNKLPDIYDAYVVGSDQVWLKKFGTATFFGFLPEDSKAKRYSYAASFGADKWRYDEKTTKECSDLIKKFEAVSVRETSGITLCRQYLGIDASVVLDPTMLLDRQDYEKLIEEIPSSENGKYIMTYILDSSPEKCRIIENISKHYGLPVRSFTVPKKTIVPPIEEWLAGFRDAAYVITDSFHGTVFSVIFSKKFITLLNAKRGASRFHSFLGILNLNDRLVTATDSLDMTLVDKDIDYESVKRILDEKREESLNFLRQIR